MNALFVGQDRQWMRATAAVAMVFLVAACTHQPQDRFQGYVEGEFVYVASPLAGQLETLSVQRGQQVKIGQPLFALDETAEKAAREQIKAALVLSEAELARQEKLFRSGVAASQDLDRARSTRDQDKKRLDQTDWSFEQKKQAAPQSGLVYDTLFRQVLIEASRAARRPFRVLEWEGESPDHPQLLAVPETHYLKCAVLQAL